MFPKIVLAGILTALLGAAAGMLAIHSRTAPELEGLQAQRAKLQSDYAAMQREAELARQRADRMDQRNAELQGHIMALEQQLNEMRATMAMGFPMETPGQGMFDEAPTLDAAPDDPVNPMEARRAAMGPGGRGPWEWTEEERAEWEAQRAERATQMREAMENATRERIARIPDPAARERLWEIHRYTQDMMEFQGDAFTADNDDDRALFQQAARETAEQMNALIQRHRQATLESLAEQAGAEDPRAFADMLQQLQRDDPLLGMGPGMFMPPPGPGPGGGRPGFGPGGGGGFGGPGFGGPGGGRFGGPPGGPGQGS